MDVGIVPEDKRVRLKPDATANGVRMPPSPPSRLRGYSQEAERGRVRLKPDAPLRVSRTPPVLKRYFGDVDVNIRGDGGHAFG